MPQSAPHKSDWLTISETARRAGLNASALRFYERRGLIESTRTQGNQRRYHRSVLRRIGVVQVAQQVGLTLNEIEQALSELPAGRTPTKKDWVRLSSRWRQDLDNRITQLQLMRERLSGCIGCGCLSLKNCQLYNPDDRASVKGDGPRYLLGDNP